MQRWKDGSTVINAMMLPAKPSSYGAAHLRFVERYITFLGEEGEDACFVRKFGDNPLCIVFCHGNYMDVGETEFTDVAKAAKKLKCTLVAPEYPGYGLSSGTVGEAPCIRAAFQCVQFVVGNLGFKPSQMIVYGQSIGSGVAVQLVLKMQKHWNHVPLALILQSALTSVKDLAKQLSFFGNFIANRFNSIKTIPALKLRNFFLMHGTNDELIHYNHSMRLYGAAEHIPNKDLDLIDNATHNLFPNLAPRIISFINNAIQYDTTNYVRTSSAPTPPPTLSPTSSSFFGFFSSLSSRSCVPSNPSSLSSADEPTIATSSASDDLVVERVLEKVLTEDEIIDRFAAQTQYVKSRQEATQKYLNLVSSFSS
eukprot:m.27379 g.27379  ORF g.27379 m.27379 type:complete len:367 (-) comp9347_c1_seq1:159-1259(-)